MHADPHPGNILLTPEGRLGLIDYGQIKLLGPTQRRTLAKLIIALADGDKQVRGRGQEAGGGLD